VEVKLRCGCTLGVHRDVTEGITKLVKTIVKAISVVATHSYGFVL